MKSKLHFHNHTQSFRTSLHHTHQSRWICLSPQWHLGNTSQTLRFPPLFIRNPQGFHRIVT
ncbi:hypothetical protein M422DRAFT_32023, partial [Sphaerobolus stellatus SS14]